MATLVWTRSNCMPKSMATNITEDIIAVFKAIASGDYDNFALFSCFINGEPGSCIVSIIDEGDFFTIHPLFVSVTPKMILTDHEGQEPRGD